MLPPWAPGAQQPLELLISTGRPGLCFGVSEGCRIPTFHNSVATISVGPGELYGCRQEDTVVSHNRTVAGLSFRLEMCCRWEGRKEA